jgi:GNAT superfamily N-acetyltransferase
MSADPFDSTAFTVRVARPDDVPDLFAMVRELAQFEQLEHLLDASEADMHAELFGRDGGAEALVAEGAERDGAAARLIGYAIFFENFSSFLCRRGLYLEDIYVRPEYRRRGVGKAFLRQLAQIARRRESGRMEWVVLNWNQNAIDAYQAIGGEVLPEWRVVRLDRAAIERLADGGTSAGRQGSV